VESVERPRGKSSELVQWRCNWPMSAHASQAFSIAHCTDLEDLPTVLQGGLITARSGRLALRDWPSKQSNSVKKERKIRAIMPFKVIEVSINGKRVCDFLLVINSN